MGGFIKRDVERVETTALNTKVHRAVFDNFKDYCKYLGYPMNLILETFMQQYTNRRIHIDHADIMKWKSEDYETDTLNTTFNKNIYLAFKARCKGNGYFVKQVIIAFMELFAQRTLVLEYVGIDTAFSTRIKEITEKGFDEGARKEIFFESPRGHLRCPFCGRYVEAISDNWLLVQPGRDTKKYLACRECEGLDGKYRY